MAMVIAGDEHEALFQELMGVMTKYANKMTKVEILAVVANMCGKAIALQDQRSMTPEKAMEVVMRNIEVGNRQIFDSIMSVGGTKQ